MRYLFNTPILTSYGDYRFEGPLTLAAARQSALQPMHSAIGHAGTARFLSRCLGLEVHNRREAIRMQPGEQALVFRLLDRLPDFAGSALRGVFGHALRAAACVTGLPDCSPCTFYRSCRYPAIFETPLPLSYPRRKLNNIPQSFVVEPPPWGDSHYPAGSVLSFDSGLIGPALQQLPLLLLALRHALQCGLGPQRGTAKLAQLWARLN